MKTVNDFMQHAQKMGKLFAGTVSSSVTEFLAE